MDSWQNCCLPVTVRTIHKMLSSIKQVKVGRGIPMLCIRSIVHYINIYSRIVIQLNMYVKIITSSGFKSTILTDFVQGQLRVPFRFGRCLKFPGSTLIYRKLSSPPQALPLRARLDTKWRKKIGPEVLIKKIDLAKTFQLTFVIILTYCHTYHQLNR